MKLDGGVGISSTACRIGKKGRLISSRPAITRVVGCPSTPTTRGGIGKVLNEEDGMKFACAVNLHR
ncbi:MAG: hypothetical protein WCC95_10785, partial [Candidatus Sulfotelmatobacter sp.]